LRPSDEHRQEVAVLFTLAIGCQTFSERLSGYYRYRQNCQEDFLEFLGRPTLLGFFATFSHDSFKINHMRSPTFSLSICPALAIWRTLPTVQPIISAAVAMGTYRWISGMVDMTPNISYDGKISQQRERRRLTGDPNSVGPSD
jgi:hypothetical protein